MECCGHEVGPTGFCDHCGRRRVPEEDPPTSTVSLTAPVSTRRSLEGDLWGGDFQSLPAVELPDPEGLILDDPTYPEKHQYCGKCEQPVGRAYAGQPGFAEGFCENCGEPFSFLPKLKRGERVADRYDVLGCFARGGLGWVYLATDSALGDHYVALKGVINRGSARARQLAVVEKDVLTRLDHPNIVRIVDFAEHPAPLGEKPDRASGNGDVPDQDEARNAPPEGELSRERGSDRHRGEMGSVQSPGHAITRARSPINTDTYIVMEYVGGRSLRDILAKPGQLRVEHVITYGRAILAALDYLHGEGLLYCDMKPDNVIHGDKRVKVIDLGAARSIDDRVSVAVGTDGYQVSPAERATYGLTVRSDLHTVGKTLRKLLDAAPPDPDADTIAFGVEALERVLDRAVAPYQRRFASAAEMAEQLDGVRREIQSLRDKRPRPVPSSRFEDTAELLDAGLGAVPGLARWTGARPVDPYLDPGLPGPRAAASKFPIPWVDEADPGAAFIGAARAPGPRRWLDKLATFAGDSVEIEFARTRALVELGETARATGTLARAEELLGDEASYDWRASWHHGLLALAKENPGAAEKAFDQVHRTLPGEHAPQLALGLCAELLGKPDRAKRCYEAVWRRDNTQASAAFGLARGYLREADRQEAVSILDEVPEVSRHYDAARIASVRIRAGTLRQGPPTVADLADAVRRLPELYVDGESRDLLTALVREAARGVGTGWNGGEPLGDPVTEDGLAERLEASYRRLAGYASDANEFGVLVDLANSVRPKTRR